MAQTDHGGFRVLIIGGGPAGLLTAQALQKNGIRCTVFEQDAAVDARPRDWNFGIYWAQVPLEDCLPAEISRQVEDAQVDSHVPSTDDVMPIYNGQSGELLKSLPVPYNIRLNRRKFLRLISTGLDIRYGKRLIRLVSNGQTATAEFEDGSSETGDLLIGAEGAHSKVRDYLLGPEKAALQMSPIVASVTMAKLPRETAMLFRQVHPRLCVTFHPNGYFTWIGVHDADKDREPGEWTFMIIQSWMGSSEHDPASLTGSKILEDMKTRGKEFGEPFNAIVQSIPRGTPCWHNRLSYWITQPWDNRNSTVTLVGDAAHPMTFHRGQGLNNAIFDVASLAKELKERGTAVFSGSNGGLSAVSAYEQEVWQRGKEAVIASNENSLSTHDWNKLLRSPLFTSGLGQKLVRNDVNEAQMAAKAAEN